MQPKNLSMNSGPVVGSKPKRGPGFQGNDSAPADTRHNYQGEMFQAGPNQTMEEIQKSVMQSTETKLHNRGVYKNIADANRAVTRTNQSYVQGMMEAQQAFTKAQKASEDFDTMAFQTNKDADSIQNMSSSESELFAGRDKKTQKTTKNGFDEVQVASGNEETKKVLKKTILETPAGDVLNSPKEEIPIQMPNSKSNAFSEDKTDDVIVPEVKNDVPVNVTDEEHERRLKYAIGRAAFITKEIESNEKVEDAYDSKKHFSPESSCRICVSSSDKNSKLEEYLSQNKKDIISIMGDTIGLPDESDLSHRICINGIGNTAEIMVQGFDLSSVKDKQIDNEANTLRGALMHAVKDKLNDYGDPNASIHENTSRFVNISDFEAGMSNEMIFDKPIMKFGEKPNEKSDATVDQSFTQEQQLNETLLNENQSNMAEDQPIF